MASDGGLRFRGRMDEDCRWSGGEFRRSGCWKAAREEELKG